ncbi:Pyrimidine/purine nucleoside phosphorylase [Dissostichus eleginoides]|nr:Pyrimidine/purine nucleoside phosphorylase [Dissostichus eleginoides]
MESECKDIPIQAFVGDLKLLKTYQDHSPYPAKIRIHWENGPRLYTTATEAAEDMRTRGFSMDLLRPTSPDWEQKLAQGDRWSRADRYRTERVREKLKDFHRQKD